MKLSPLKNYRGPDYPTRAILQQHPELLRALPRRWQNNAVVLGTLAGLLTLMEQSTAQAGDKATLHVAPIFEHGSGHGAFGCVAVSPPVFLTEAEAREVIEDEAKKADVDFAERGHKLNGVALPVTDEVPTFAQTDPKDAKKKAGKKSQIGDLELNGWDARLQAGYKFVALADFEAWEAKDRTIFCSVSDYNMLDAAKRLQAGLGAVKETGTVAVFYEPAGSAPKAAPWQNSQKAAKKAGLEDLRMQVRDYIAWLKAQGII